MIQDVQQKLEELEQSCRDAAEDSLAVFEKAELLLPLLSLGEAEQNYAEAKLAALVERYNPRELYTVLVGHLSDVCSGSAFAALLRLIGQALAGFTRKEALFWASLFPMVYGYLDNHAVVKDSMFTTVEQCVIGEESDEQTSPKRKASSSDSFAKACSDFRDHSRTYLNFVAQLTKDYTERPWPATALLLQFCFQLLWYQASSHRWPAPVGSAGSRDMGLPLLDAGTLR
eukprot:RCo046416